MRRPCYVLDDGERLPGYVLAWVRDVNGWHAVVRYSRISTEGWPVNYEHAVQASQLEPRSA